MSPEMKAFQICESSQNQRFMYKGPDKAMKGRVGCFEILEDMNCCAPTQDVLFAFQSSVSRKVMDADELLAFYKDCTPLA